MSNGTFSDEDGDGTRDKRVLEMFEVAFRNRDLRTGRLLLPLELKHLIGHLMTFVYELGQRVVHTVPTDEVVARAIHARIQLFGHHPELFGHHAPQAQSTPNVPRTSHEDVGKWLIQEAAAVCADEWLCALARFDPGTDTTTMLRRFFDWWKKHDDRIAAEWEYRLANGQRPADPVTCLVFDVIRPTWKTEPPLDRVAVLAYKLEAIQTYFSASPTVVKRRINETLNHMTTGVMKDSRIRRQISRVQRRTHADVEQAEAAILRRFAKMAEIAEAAVRAGHEPRSLFGPVSMDPAGGPSVHVDRDGVAGSDAVCRELRIALKAERFRPEHTETDVEMLRASTDEAERVREIRDQTDLVRRLRATFAAEGDAAALAFIDWKSGEVDTLMDAAALFRVTPKAVRCAERRIGDRFDELRAG